MERYWFVILLLILNPPILGAEVEWTLEGQDHMALDLDQVAINIVFQPDVEPFLRLTSDSTSGLDPATLLSFSNEPSQLMVRRGFETGSFALDLILHPEQRVSIFGGDLEVVISEETPRMQPPLHSEASAVTEEKREGDEEDEEGEEGEGEEAEASGHRVILDVENAQLHLSSLDGVNLRAVNSAIWVADSLGSWHVELKGGRGEFLRHQGGLTLAGQEAEFQLSECSGKTSLSASGGSIAILGGEVILQASLEDVSVEMERWVGRARFEGSNFRAEIRDSGGAGARIEAMGRGMDLSLADWRGSLRVDLEGGSLKGERWQGSSRLNLGQGAEASVEEVEGGMALVAEDASAQLARISSTVTAKIFQGDLTGIELEHLRLEASDARLDLERVVQLNISSALNSELEIEFGERHKGSPKMDLRGWTRASIQAPAPCRVQLEDSVDAFASQVEVAGCEVRSAQIPLSHADAVSPDGRPPLVLRVQMESESELEVRGSHGFQTGDP